MNHPLATLARLPLGWLQLRKDKPRLLVAIAGVAFAVILILMQLGFRESMFASAVRYHEHLRYDVVLLSSETAFIVQPHPFSSRRLYQALGAPGVASVAPIYAGLGDWRNPHNGDRTSIYVVGVRPEDDPLELPGLAVPLGRTALADFVLFDEASRPDYGPIAAELRAGGPVTAELNNREVSVVGLFQLGTSFGISGSVITSDANFLRLFPFRTRGLIDFGLVRLHPGADPDRVRDALRASLPGDVLVFTRSDFIARERTYWDTYTPIGYVFAFGVMIGLVVGSIIVYQILFADVTDHLPEYATLKAMGYSDTFLGVVVIQQASILATLGYLPGVAIALGLYQTAGRATRLPLEMTWERAAGVFVLTLAMCSLSALMALRKVRAADPADVF